MIVMLTTMIVMMIIIPVRSQEVLSMVLLAWFRLKYYCNYDCDDGCYDYDNNDSC